VNNLIRNEEDKKIKEPLSKKFVFQCSIYILSFYTLDYF